MDTTSRAEVLIVDDTPTNLKILSDMLSKKGYKIRPALNGEIALKSAQTHPPDIILLDIHMPEMDGYQVCEKLKANDELADIPVIFISALHETFNKVQAFHMGGVDYITKPFQFEEVESRIETHLKIRKLQLELKTYNERLEEVVAERTRQLVIANDQLQVLDKAKSDFLALISHELRTPLNGMAGVEMILESNEFDEEDFTDIKEIFRTSYRRLLKLVDQALTITEINVGKYDLLLIPCKLSEIISLLLDMCQSQMQHKAIQASIDIDPDIDIQAEPQLLLRALSALFETAVKLTEDEKVITISQQASDDYVILSFQTSGIHLPEAFLTSFYEPLTIAKPLVKNGDLGLAPHFAQCILKLFSCELWIENCLHPKGIQFHMSFHKAEEL